MHQQSNGSLRRRGILIRLGIAVALGASVPVAVSGCPGPPPETETEGTGGHTSSSHAASGTASSSGSPACPASEGCVTAAPDPWKGPVAVYDGVSTLSCPPDLSEAWSGGVDPVKVACPTCACDPPASATCTVAATFAAGTACAGPDCPSTLLPPKVCTPLTGTVTCTVQAPFGLRLEAAATGEACTPTVPKPTLPSPTWETNVLACAPASAATCSAGVCAPDPADAGAFALCIYRPDDVPACPAGPYATRRVIGTKLVDTRHCSDCTCGLPEGTCDGGTARISSDPGCDGGTPVPAPDDCAPSQITAGNVPLFAVLVSPPPLSGASCAPDGGKLTGTLAEGGLMTLCCM